ncbi:MAG TPA: arginine--tRNA ligase [Eubacterium sp.]|nr:arginine--tRNA ligase [Eubacterium sp.]
MKSLLNILSEELKGAFEKCGYNGEGVVVTFSNRPELCEYQCNSALSLAKAYKCAPMVIAGAVCDCLKGSTAVSEAVACAPGFINLKISPSFLASYVEQMRKSGCFGLENDSPKTIMIDYGGANVAKPLHIGHLRSAIIGECIKRLGRMLGNTVISDVHLGDWGLQMGLIIEELRDRKPELVYFDENYEGEYPLEAPFTISELEDIYPAASAKSKVDEVFAERAHAATLRLQKKEKAYYAIWKHIMSVSLADLKKNYANLLVSFDLWEGESDAEPYIADMLDDFINRGIAYESENALVVDVSMEGDKKELPPCIVRKSDGSALYATSDLATIIKRQKLYKPDRYIYVADKRQELHFTQVFRTARKAGLVPSDVRLDYLGFGTMNGKDGKPFKTRAGGVLRLEYLISDINKQVYDRITAVSEEENQFKKKQEFSADEAEKISKIIGLAAIKYGDLSNQAVKDYIFDIDKFASFEGNTGPYIQYTIVRINSILARGGFSDSDIAAFDIGGLDDEYTKAIGIKISSFADVLKDSFEELAPHKICQYIYSMCETFSGFYNNVRILAEEDEDKKKNYLALIAYVRDILVHSAYVLGFEVPDKM